MKQFMKKLEQNIKDNRPLMDNLPAKCKMYLNLLISVKDEKKYCQIPKTIRKNYENFTDIFKKLDDNERAYFIFRNIQFANQTFKKCICSTPTNICEIETTCEVKTTWMKVTFWEKRTIKFEYKMHRVKFSTSKKQEIFDLKSYLVRKSNSQKNGLVLESFQPIISQKYQKISFKFNNSSICEQILCSIRQSVIQISFQRLECLLHDDSNDQKSLKLAEQKEKMNLTLLTNKNISDYFEDKQSLIDILKKGRKNVFGFYSEHNLTIMTSLSNADLYYLEYCLPETWTNLAQIYSKIKILGETSVEADFTCQKLEKFNDSISANYYRIFFQGEQFEMIMMVQKNQKNGYIQQVMKSTSNIFFGVNVTFIEIIVKKAKQNQYVLNISAVIKKNPHKNTIQNARIIPKFLVSLVRPSHFNGKNSLTKERSPFSPTKKKTQVSQDSSSGRSKSANRNFRTETNTPRLDSPAGCQIKLDILNECNFADEEDAKDEVYYSIEDIEDVEQLGEMEHIQDIYHTIISSKFGQNWQDLRASQRHEAVQTVITYLHAKCINSPCQKLPIKYILEHNLQVDWKKSQKGGVICINTEAIEEQKKVIKLLLSQLGSKIYKMKGIINFSLPIQICRAQSALVSMGRNISYAPLLLEGSSQMTPLERIKKIVILHISWCALALSTQKPFNPILGQTYQGFLNGCPLFMQQISHHPPVSSLYFVGRGYKIYGKIAPVINLRLNYINAVDDQLLTVEFDNGDKCIFSVSTMVVNGILIGQRSIYFDGTGHVIDKTNNLIAEIKFNAKNNSLFKARQNPDFFMGEIYKVSQSFMDKFLASERKLSFKKDDKNRLIETISGQWNGVIMFNNQKVFDLAKELPVLLQNSENPLPSDGVFRQDVINRKIGDVVKGQEEKQRLEEIQRRDKKLREKVNKCKK